MYMEAKIMKVRMVFVAMAGFYGCGAGLKRQNFTKNLQLLVNGLAPITSILVDYSNRLLWRIHTKACSTPIYRAIRWHSANLHVDPGVV